MIEPLPELLVEPIVRAALVEDLGRAGDITTDAVIPATARFDGAIAARQPGVIAGIEAARLAFRLLDPAIEVAVEKPDGAPVARATSSRGSRARRAASFPPSGWRSIFCAGCPASPRATARLVGGGQAASRANRLHPQDHPGPARSRESTRCARAAASITASASTTRC